MTHRTIVTGGSSGIGAALARQAHDDGHDVIVVSRRAGPVGRSTPIGFAGEVDGDAYRRNVLLNSAASQIIGDAFLRATREAGVPAMFVLLSSGAATSPYRGWSAYCAGKAAGDHWTRTVGLEQADRGAVTVVSIAPGVVDTAMQAEIRDTDASDFPNLDRFVDLHASDELADPEDVAARLRATVPHLATGSVTDLRSL